MALPRRTLLLAVVAGAAATATACKKAPAELTCTDTEGLTPAERALRVETLAYVDRTPYPAKTCDACQLYRPAAPDACGGCSVLKGPVHPRGYCTSWIARAPV
jgi:hypothetical protein